MATLHWRQEGVRWMAYTEERPRHAHMLRLMRAEQTSAERDSLWVNPFAMVRPERSAGGDPDPTTGRWLVVISANRLPPGATSFDMLTTHASLDAARQHVTAIAALHGVTD